MNAAALIDFEHETMSPREFRVRLRETRPPQVETYSYISSPLTMERPQMPALLPLFTFAFEGAVFHLHQAIMLRVAFEDGEYFVENDALSLFGNGKTLLDAIGAFSRDLGYYWRYYRSLRNDEVSGAGVELKRLYESLVSA